MSSHMTQEFLSSQLRACIPKLSGKHHKGQFGRIAVLGGCMEYSGAPHFAATAGSRVGADVAYIVCCKSAANSIKSFNPETIVLPLLRTTSEAETRWGLGFGHKLQPDQIEAVQKEVEDGVGSWMKAFHVLVVGPGLGRDELVQACARDAIRRARRANIPIVIDGDGIVAIESELDTVKNYRRLILTPNVVEYGRLCRAVLGIDVGKDGLPVVRDDEGRQQKVSEESPEMEDDAQSDGRKSCTSIERRVLKRLAKALGHVTILKKGPVDMVSDGTLVVQCTRVGGLRRCGGQGDVLAGMAATLIAWNYGSISTYSLAEKIKDQEGHLKLASKAVLAAWGAASMTRECARRAFLERHRGTTLSHLLNHVGPVFYDLCEHQTDDVSEFEAPYSDYV